MACKVVVGNFLNDIAGQPFDFDAANLSMEDDLPPGGAHDGPGKLGTQFATQNIPSALLVYLTLLRMPAAYWTAIVGSVADSADQDHGADATSLKVLSNLAHIDSPEIEVRSGYSYWIEGWAFGTGAGPTGKISLYNPSTGHWWDGTAWVGAIAYLATSAAAAWVGIGAGAGVRVDVEAASITLGPTTTLQVQLWRIDNSTAGAVYFDDILLYPGVDFIGIFGGHNIPPALPVLWKSTTAAGVQTTRGTFTKARNQFFLALGAPVFAPLHSVSFPSGVMGTDGNLVYLGELVVGQMVTLLKSPMEPVAIEYSWAGQARLETPGGSRHIANRGAAPVRRVTLNFRYANAAQEAQALQVWVDQVQGGAQSVAIFPSTLKFPGLLVYGDIGGQQALSVSLHGAKQDGQATGDLAGANDTQDHYSDLSVVIDEGAVFSLD